MPPWLGSRACRKLPSTPATTRAGLFLTFSRPFWQPIPVVSFKPRVVNWNQPRKLPREEESQPKLLNLMFHPLSLI
jgi:hypothetical protein